MNTIGDLLEAKGIIIMTTERKARAAKLRSEIRADLNRFFDESDGFDLDVVIVGPDGKKIEASAMLVSRQQLALRELRRLRQFDTVELRTNMTRARHGLGVMIPNKQHCNGCPLELYTATYTHHLRTCNDCTLSRLEVALKQ